MMREHDLKKQKENEEYEELKAAIVEELCGAVNPKVSIAQANASQIPSLKRVLKKAGGNPGADVSSADAMVPEPSGPDPYSQDEEEAVAEQCAYKLYAKFKAMGSKAKRKTG